MAAMQPGPDAIRFKVPEEERKGDTVPIEYAVEWVQLDGKPHLGGCMIYGRYGDREGWKPNCSARWLVRHLIETVQSMGKMIEAQGTTIDAVMAELDGDGEE